MGEPRNHHYVPQFYLKLWSGKDSRLTYYKKINGALISDSIRPKSTGFERDLYTLDYLPAQMRQAFEEYVTAQVDDRGANAIRKLRAEGAESLTPQERLE